jgi:hypothetical protein
MWGKKTKEGKYIYFLLYSFSLEKLPNFLKIELFLFSFSFFWHGLDSIFSLVAFFLLNVCVFFKVFRQVLKNLHVAIFMVNASSKDLC